MAWSPQRGPNGLVAPAGPQTHDTAQTTLTKSSHPGSSHPGRWFAELGASSGSHGALWEPLGALREPLRVIANVAVAAVGSIPKHLRSCSKCFFEASLERLSWGSLGTSCDCLGAVLEALGASAGSLGALWQPLGAMLELSWRLSGPLGALLGVSWGSVGGTWGIAGPTAPTLAPNVVNL